MILDLLQKKKDVLEKMREMPFFPAVPIIPIALLAANVAISIFLLNRLRKLESRLGSW